MKKTFDKQSTIKSVIAHSEKLSGILAAEQLKFKGNITMKDINLPTADGNTARKLRRIIEKRVCQDFWNTHKGEYHQDGWGRAKMKREIAKQLDEVCGGYAEYRFAV